MINVSLMIAMLTFVTLYSSSVSQATLRRQTEHFENTTITMEHVTQNYLEGEQRICDVWAHYINSTNMTMEEAISFIRTSHVLPNASAHIVDLETLTGVSTRAHNDTSDDYSVSYSRLNLLNDAGWINENLGASFREAPHHPHQGHVLRRDLRPLRQGPRGAHLLSRSPRRQGSADRPDPGGRLQGWQG